MLLVVLLVLRMKFDKSVFYVKNTELFDSGYVTSLTPSLRTSHHLYQEHSRIHSTRLIQFAINMGYRHNKTLSAIQNYFY